MNKYYFLKQLLVNQGHLEFRYDCNAKCYIVKIGNKEIALSEEEYEFFKKYLSGFA